MPEHPDPSLEIESDSPVDLTPEALRALCRTLYVEECETMMTGHRTLLRHLRSARHVILSMARLGGDFPPGPNLPEMLRTLRVAGWSVGVHNDYHQRGRRHTFWLFTQSDGRYLKGEGPTDVDAVAAVIAAAGLAKEAPAI